MYYFPISVLCVLFVCKCVNPTAVKYIYHIIYHMHMYVEVGCPCPVQQICDVFCLIFAEYNSTVTSVVLMLPVSVFEPCILGFHFMTLRRLGVSAEPV
jgi:hypothetical protein